MRLLPEEEHGVSMSARVNAQPDCPPDGLGHLSLVDWPQSGFLGVLDPSHWCHEFGNDGEVL